jgi:hypothetical protein
VLVLVELDRIDEAEDAADRLVGPRRILVDLASEISWIWFSLSCSVIFFMSLSMRRSTSRLAAPRAGCSATSSLDCVAATTPPASVVPNTTVASTPF